MRSRNILIALFTIVFAICSYQLSFCQPNISFEITSFGTLDGYQGYFQEMGIEDELNETHFLFEENGYIRWYAYKMSGQDEFEILPEGIYIVKCENLQIGDQWYSWWGGIATVIDTATVLVGDPPVGTTFTYIVENRNIDGDVESYIWWSYEFGWVRILNDDMMELSSWSILGGSGYFPLHVGNRWEFSSPFEYNVFDLSIDSTTFIFDNTCFVINSYWDSTIFETSYYTVENDTLYCRGIASHGYPPEPKYYILSPLHPTIGSEWYGEWDEFRVRFLVEDIRPITVPAGTFDAYEYYATDSITGDYIGKWYVSNGIGIIKQEMVVDNDTVAILLQDYTIVSGNGVIPIAIGNHLTYIREGYTGIDEQSDSNIPSKVKLNQNYPNPFNAQTNVSFNLIVPGNVQLDIYNMMGQKVETLVDGYLKAQPYEISWDASEYSSGIYFYKLATNNQTLTKRMTLLK
ncbi:MAG: T9SS type A sorting domain-containing protein [candidate division Zixibacteria bacterium]|nr:T9SS type A sorting domain-containing protein [candidate division Zixibacteria bacterium]